MDSFVNLHNVIIRLSQHLKHTATLPCEISTFKKCQAQGLSEANSDVRFSHSKSHSQVDICVYT